MKQITFLTLVLLLFGCKKTPPDVDPTAARFDRAFEAIKLPLDSLTDYFVQGKYNGQFFRLSDASNGTLYTPDIGEIFSSSSSTLDPNDASRKRFIPEMIFMKNQQQAWDSLGYMFYFILNFRSTTIDSTWAQVAQRHFQKEGDIVLSGRKNSGFDRNGILFQLGGQNGSGASPIAYTAADSLSQKADNFLRLDKIEKTQVGGQTLYDLTFKFDVLVYRQSVNSTFILAGRITDGLMRVGIRVPL